MVKKKAEYNSNPFTLSFNALGKFFENNIVWALVLVGIAFFGFLAQLTARIIGTISSNPDHTATTTTASGTINTPGVIAIVVLGLIGFLILLIFAVASIALYTYISGLYSYVALRSLEGKQVSASEAFGRVNKRFWPLLSAQLLAIVKIIGWLFVFIIPGIVAAYRYALLPYVAVSEDGKSAKDIHNRTKLLVKKRLWEVFGIQFVAGIVPFIGNLVGYSGRAALYRQMQISTDTKTEKPRIHWLNYLGIIIGAIVLLFAILIGSLALIIYLANR